MKWCCNWNVQGQMDARLCEPFGIQRICWFNTRPISPLITQLLCKWLPFLSIFSHTLHASSAKSPFHNKNAFGQDPHESYAIAKKKNLIISQIVGWERWIRNLIIQTVLIAWMTPVESLVCFVFSTCLHNFFFVSIFSGLCAADMKSRSTQIGPTSFEWIHKAEWIQ